MPLPRLAIGAIIKNEAPYLLEWVAYHRVLGVERFFIADNGSTDGGSPLLAALDAARAGAAPALPRPARRAAAAPRLPGDPRRARPRGRLDRLHRRRRVPGPRRPPRLPDALPGLVARLGADPGVGAILVNWALYGSSGRLEAGPGPGDRALRPARRAGATSRPITTSSRSCAPWPAPSRAATRMPSACPAPWRAVHADGRDLAPHPLGIDGLSREVVWGPLRLNHYVVKSREEFLTRKLPRGRATTDRLRAPGFFEVHDRNEVADPVDPALAEATRRERARIARRLGGRTAAGGACPIRPGAGARDFLRAGAGALVLDQPARVAAQEVGADHEEAARRRRARRGSRRSRGCRSRRSRPGPAPPRARGGSTT